MIINTKSYADFKNCVTVLRHLDQVFFNYNVTLPGGGVDFVIFAVDSSQERAVQCGISMGSSPPSQATVLADFPQAIQLEQYLYLSASSSFSL